MAEQREPKPHELVLEYTPSSGEEQTVIGTPIELLNHLVDNNIKIAWQNLILSNHVGYLLSRKNEEIIEFLIFQSTGQQLGKVHVGNFMFEVEFRDKQPKFRTALYDIFYVLNRPSNSELTGASKITLVRRTEEDSESLKDLFEYAGKKDIKDLLQNWTKRFEGFETPEQVNSEIAVKEIKGVSQTIDAILSESETVPEPETAPAVAQANVLLVESLPPSDLRIKNYAVKEQISAIKELVLKGDTEKAINYLDVLTFLLKQ